METRVPIDKYHITQQRSDKLDVLIPYRKTVDNSLYMASYTRLDIAYVISVLAVTGLG